VTLGTLALAFAAALAVGLLSYPLLGAALAPFAGAGVGLALLLLLRFGTVSTGSRRSRLAALACAALTAGVGQFMQRALVFNWSDNAYLLVALLGLALMVPAALFLAAALIPVRIVQLGATWAGVGLVYIIGVLGILPAPFLLVASGASIAQALNPSTSPVAASHLAAAGLCPLLIGLVTLLQRWQAPPARPLQEATP
jgi:hypothetical protein